MSLPQFDIVVVIVPKDYDPLGSHSVSKLVCCRQQVNTSMKPTIDPVLVKATLGSVPRSS